MDLGKEVLLCSLRLREAPGPRASPGLRLGPLRCDTSTQGWLGGAGPRRARAQQSQGTDTPHPVKGSLIAQQPCIPALQPTFHISRQEPETSHPSQ